MKRLKQSLLDNCVGLPLDEAEKLVRDAGLKPFSVEGSTITLEIRSGKVVLCHNGDKVTFASPGNPGELEVQTAEEILRNLKLV